MLTPRSAGWLASAGVTVAAGVAGWVLAGPPGDATAITPPDCPASYGQGLHAAGSTGRPGAADRLVPVGPVSVRVCGYIAGAGVPGARRSRSLILDPIRTADLAAVLDPMTDPQARPAPAALADSARRATCVPGAEPALLVFRYKLGSPLTVAVDDGACALVSTPLRAELGRADVVRRVTDLLNG